MKIKIINQSNNPIPSYETIGSSGMDIRAYLNEEIVILPFERKLVSTGIAIELPEGYEAQLRPRSGLANKFGITLPNSPATIDSDYRGEIKVGLINLSSEPFRIKSGDRIAQMIIAKYEKITFEEVDLLSETARGSGGFGSTGVK